MPFARTSYDVAVVGGGPVGCVTAIAHAQRGARVLILEADVRAAQRFAGEWIHPTGVGVLDELRIGRLERAHARSGYGFVILPDDGSPGIEMPYTSGVALSAEHGSIVGALREAAMGHDLIEFASDARVVRIEGDRLRAEDRKTGAGFDVRADRIVGADGKRSTVRQQLDLEDSSAALSYMASVELHGVTLPWEGFGHVVLGGPGPALLYRIGDDLIRGCLDLPIALGAGARSRDFLWDGFAPVFPESLRGALHQALERGPSAWAVNRFRPRNCFGRGRVALVGDAVGHVHPMTAIGMSMGFLDARALAESDTIEEYAKARRSYIPELLSNALYHCFRRDDASASSVRRAMFDTLRADKAERSRTIDVMAGVNPSRRTFGSSFLRIAAQAVGRTVKGSAERGKLSTLPSALASFGEWMQWPAALVVPSHLDNVVRAKSSSTHPIPQLEGFVKTAAPVQAPERDVDRREASEDIPLADAIERGTAILHTELERIAMRVGTVPDATLARPALSSMRAIVSTSMSAGMAARMTLGRRRLSVDGFSRLLADAEAVQCRHLAELALVLLDGASWQELPIASLAEGVRALLDCQHPRGYFVHKHGASAVEVDFELTALACRAIDVVLYRRPDATDADLSRVLDRAAEFVRASQSEDGGWAEGSGDPISRAAWAIETLITGGTHPGDAAVRRAIRFLAARAQPEGGFAAEGDAIDRRASARALRALILAGAPAPEAIVKTARFLARELEAGDLDWEEARDLVEGLAACEARRATRPRKQKRASAPAPGMVIAEDLKSDWAFCKESLGEVSRTFSRPIAMLPPRLEVAVTLGYLLCRVADTIEDHTKVDPAMRDALFALFLAVLEKNASAEPFAEAFCVIDGEDAELSLARSLPRVMRVYEAQDDAVKRACVRWVSEMARGMSLYTHRLPGEDGVAAVHTVADLERYCYYVAGTVGHLLTDLFVHEIGADPEGQLALALRDRAEGFAMGLQLTNILKDVTDDLSRGVSYVPRSECVRQGFAVARLADPEVRDRAHAAVAPIFRVARARLDDALEYSLAIPADRPQIRLFCLLPLWMAARTLVLAKGNDAMFTPSEPVKIARAEVEELIADCVRHVSDDAALRTRYELLYKLSPVGNGAEVVS
jgi:phytoene/squalene synthetase/2-polyprenyl-6-methoxyphenol hydroxylase-like FAD-dependent oxidoreductase